ncbi:MAG: ABC transporter ATP-binding protein [Gammaproteobacteria bacterium]
MRLIREFVRRYPGQSVVLVAALLLAGVADGIGLSALLPLLNITLESSAGGESDSALSRFIFDALDTIGVSPSIGVLLSVIVAVVFFKALLVFFAKQRSGYIAAEVSTGLRTDLLKAITNSRWQYFVNQSTGKLANSMATEAWRASNAYVFAVRLLALFVEAGVYTTVALLVSWRATLISFVASFVIVAASHYFVRMAERGGKGQTRWYRSLLGTLTDILQSVKTFKAMGREGSAEEVLSVENNQLRESLRREVLGDAALEAAQEPMYTIVLAGGIYLALMQFQVDLPTILFMALVLANLLKQAGKVQKQYQRMVISESAYWAIQETIADARGHAETHTGESQPLLEQAIELRDVSFVYGDHVVLDDVSVEIPAGELTCLVGESGAGKTTIADLVIGLIKPTSGRVLIDGRPLDELDMAAWRRSIGYVPQESLLLHDSVMHNVTLGAEGLDESDVEQALKAAGAWDFVTRMPVGIHSVVGERGARLSGGQRQRVMIARALAHHPKLLILDEATSALDPATEKAICDTLQTLKRDITILAVSHQSALAEIADRVYRLSQGAVAETQTRTVPL